MKFKSSQIAKVVENDLANAAGINELKIEYALRGLIDKPVSCRFVRSDRVSFCWLWVMWDNNLVENLVVIYCSRKKMYGLAYKGKRGKCGRLLGFYGGYLECVMAI